MLKVTSKSLHDKIQVENEEVILNGPPDLLSGQIVINNDQKERLSVKELPIHHASKSILSKDALNGALRLGVRLMPNERKTETVTHQVNAQTPPGIYESTILVGGEKRKLKLVVQPSVKISITPLSFTFQGTAPETMHTTYITLVNLGNMPFQVPDIKHVTMLDLDYLCRATATAIRSKGALEGYNAMMDEITRTVSKSMTDWMNITLKETGIIIQPGEKKLLEITLTMPSNADSKKDYGGEVRLWDKVVSYTIKAHNVPKK